MHSAAAYTIWTDRESGKILREYDTAQCRHCGGHITVKPGTACTTYLIPNKRAGFDEEPGAFCRNCMGPICLPCHENGVCKHFMRVIEEKEARQRLLDACLRS